MMTITYRSDIGRGIAEEEELIQTGNDDGPKQAQDPCTDRVHRHLRVVCVGDGRSYFRIGRVVLEDARCSLSLVQVGVIEIGDSFNLICR
jgi:hypothetical protein